MSVLPIGKGASHVFIFLGQHRAPFWLSIFTLSEVFACEKMWWPFGLQQQQSQSQVPGCSTQNWVGPILQRVGAISQRELTSWEGQSLRDSRSSAHCFVLFLDKSDAHAFIEFGRIRRSVVFLSPLFDFLLLCFKFFCFFPFPFFLSLPSFSLFFSFFLPSFPSFLPSFLPLFLPFLVFSFIFRSFVLVKNCSFFFSLSL